MSYDNLSVPAVHLSLTRPVVVGYNGKKHSQDALAWGAAEAARLHAVLHVVYAANYPGMVVEPGPGLFHPEPGALETAEAITSRGVMAAVEAYPRLQVTSATEVTSPTQALTEAAVDAELVVIGTRGYGPTLGALLRSVAFAVAARATCPVVVVKGDSAARPAGLTPPVVVGTDGSDHATAAVAFAADRARTAAAPLKIVTCTGRDDATQPDSEGLRAAANAVAEEAAARVSSTHAEVVVSTQVEDCLPERVLVDASGDASLVVVGTRGRGAFQGVLLGSVSHAVIYGAQCPVAVIADVDT